MVALVPSTWVGSALRWLPAALVRPLDAWSHRRALRRQFLRQEAWLRRRSAGQLPAATPDPSVPPRG